MPTGTPMTRTPPASLGWSAFAQIRSAGGRRFDFVTAVSALRFRGGKWKEMSVIELEVAPIGG